MKAISYHHFGDTKELVIEDRPDPILTQPDSVLIEVHSASINVLDSRTRRGEMSPFVNKKFPKTPGIDFAGRILQLGANTTGFAIGDSVFGATSPFTAGAMAQRLVVNSNSIALMPPGLSYAQAASIPIVGVAALSTLRDLGKVNGGHSVLIYGASGGAGLMTIQLARFFGASVTAVCGSSGVETCQSFGANQVIDYKRGPVQLQSPFDIIVDYSGRFPFSTARAHLKPSGRFIDPSPNIPKFIGSNIANLFRRQKNLMLAAEPHSQDLAFLAKLISQQHLKPCLHKSFPLSSVQEAFNLQEAGGVVGKLAISLVEE